MFNYASANDITPSEPYLILIAVRTIVVRSLAKIEDLVSRQTVPVFVELHLATGIICKIDDDRDDPS